MTYRNRIVEHGMAKPEDLLANPRNFKIHTKMQQSMMQGILDDIGIISSVIVNKSTGFLVDGHMRVMIAMRQGIAEVPVEYVDITEEEEMKALALYDYITSKADIDKQKVQELLLELGSNSEVIQMMSAEMFPQKKTLERIINIPRLEKDIVAEIQENVGDSELDFDMARGVAVTIGDSILVCADPTLDAKLYRDMLDDDIIFYPWGSIFSALLPGRKLIVHPDPEICRLIVAFYKKAKGGADVGRLG